nr:hypothetical protein [Tanacetum cinerariifolium]
MDMTIDQQVALDEALVPQSSRLRIGRGNFRLQSNISFKESTLQLVYDVLRLTPFFKAFLVTADILKIYMQEFWATATVHHHSIRFKMDNKKYIVNLEYFKEMSHICPRLPGQTFDEPPFKEEILAFLRFLGHNREIRRLTDALIVYGYLKLRFFGGFYHKRNVDFDYLLWEDFVYQVEHKDTKKCNEMYYPRFTKNTQQFGAMFPIELTNVDIRNSEAYKQYFAVATGDTPPKTKAKETRDEESFDPIPKTPKNIDNEGNGEENIGLNVDREEGKDEEDDEDELYRDVNINLKGKGVQVAD